VDQNLAMRRMLFTFAGGTGHFLPLVPFARAAENAGHIVAFGAQPGMLATLAEAGFSAWDTGGRTLLETTERTPLLEFDLAREERAVRDGYAGRTARERATKVRQLCESWHSDIVVCDEMDFGALVAAEALGIPYATVITIGSGALVRPELVREPLNALRSEHGLPPDPELTMLRRNLIIYPFPPSFRDPANPLPPNAHAFRTVRADRAANDDSAWIAGLGVRPLVYFTLGTIFNLESGDLFERVLAGLRELPVDVVVTVGRELDPRVLGPQPPNVYVRRYIPQSVLLPHCELVVSHAGSGSVVGALAHGLPMVLLPIGADQPFNAARCEDLHVGRVLNPIEATEEDVQLAVLDVLSDATYRQNARRVEAEIAALPDPEYGVRLLERLAEQSGHIVKPT
jgi:UDP:flavonoid glycosyltransferase YjiC (YdhE family)